MGASGIIGPCPPRPTSSSGSWSPPPSAERSAWSGRSPTSPPVFALISSWPSGLPSSPSSRYGFEAFLGEQPRQIRFDPSRVAAQIVTGIGFLGAGAILRYGATVRGLTTAASLWVVAAIGLAVALGAYLLAGVTTAITLAALWGLKRVRSKLIRGLRAEHEEVTIEAGAALDLERLVGELGRADIRVDHLRIESEEPDSRQVVMFLRLPQGTAAEEVLALLTRIPGVRNVDWTR